MASLASQGKNIFYIWWHWYYVKAQEKERTFLSGNLQEMLSIIAPIHFYKHSQLPTNMAQQTSSKIEPNLRNHSSDCYILPLSLCYATKTWAPKDIYSHTCLYVFLTQLSWKTGTQWNLRTQVLEVGTTGLAHKSCSSWILFRILKETDFLCVVRIDFNKNSPKTAKKGVTKPCGRMLFMAAFL